jgi:hypothetical protein
MMMRKWFCFCVLGWGFYSSSFAADVIFYNSISGFDYSINCGYVGGANVESFDLSLGVPMTENFDAGSYTCNAIASVDCSMDGETVVCVGAAVDVNFEVGSDGEFTQPPEANAGGVEVESCGAGAASVVIFTNASSTGNSSIYGGVMSLTWVSTVGYSPVLGRAAINQLVERLKAAFVGKKLDFEGGYEHENQTFTISLSDIGGGLCSAGQ